MSTTKPPIAAPENVEDDEIGTPSPEDNEGGRKRHRDLWQVIEQNVPTDWMHATHTWSDCLVRGVDRAIDVVIPLYAEKIGCTPKQVSKRDKECIMLEILRTYAQAYSHIASGNDDKLVQNIIKLPVTLPPYALARLISAFEHVAFIKSPDAGASFQDELCVYVDEGDDLAGTYVNNDLHHIDALISSYSPTLTAKVRKDVIADLEVFSERRSLDQGDRTIVTGNCVLEFSQDKSSFQVLPFSPDRVLRTKLATNYNPDATVSPVFVGADGRSWEFEEWFLDLFDGDEQMRDFMWLVLASMLRPRQGMEFLFMFYNDEGSNGKGTLLSLLRGIIGAPLVGSVSLQEFGNHFGLEDLIGKFAILVDENSTATFNEDATALKAVVTHDTFTVHRKHRGSVNYRFDGGMIQCVNEIPRFKDKSGSMLRRQCPIPFTKRFVGVEKRPEIRDDFMQRRELREYILNKAMSIDLTDPPKSIDDPRVPQACRDLFDEMRSENDPVVEFFNEFEAGFLGYELDEGITGGLVIEDISITYPMLHDQFSLWMAKNRKGAVIKEKEFIKQIGKLVADRPWWVHQKKLSKMMFEWSHPGDVWMRGLGAGANDPRACWTRLRDTYYPSENDAAAVLGRKGARVPLSLVDSGYAVLVREQYCQMARTRLRADRPRALVLDRSKLPDEVQERSNLLLADPEFQKRCAEQREYLEHYAVEAGRALDQAEYEAQRMGLSMCLNKWKGATNLYEGMIAPSKEEEFARINADFASRNGTSSRDDASLTA